MTLNVLKQAAFALKDAQPAALPEGATEDEQLQGELSAVATALASTGLFQVQTKLLLDAFLSADDPVLDLPTTRIGMALDVETTGREPQTDRIIELALVLFAYNEQTAEVYGVVDSFAGLEDPQMPIPEDASKVNGITDEMVRGKRIDDSVVEQFALQADLVLAHKADFDRQFCERRFPLFEKLKWGCTLTQIDWAGAGFGSAKLEFLAMRCGFFYDAHRAEADCMAMVELLKRCRPSEQEPEALAAFRQLLDACGKNSFKIWARSAPYERKDALAARGYRWSPGTEAGTEKAWWKSVSADEFDVELQWLADEVYEARKIRVPVDREDAYNRFSVRHERQVMEYLSQPAQEQP